MKRETFFVNVPVEIDYSKLTLNLLYCNLLTEIVAFDIVPALCPQDLYFELKYYTKMEAYLYKVLYEISRIVK